MFLFFSILFKSERVITDKLKKYSCYEEYTQLTFTCLTSTIETVEKGVKYIQS